MCKYVFFFVLSKGCDHFCLVGATTFDRTRVATTFVWSVRPLLTGHELRPLLSGRYDHF